MTSGEFLLKCRDIGKGGLGETGLELDVVNPVTGKVRDARTLSGGETFMASLSMALGMADIVQNTVGKTKLDTMFIDEGFGSLSDDVRDKKCEALLLDSLKDHGSLTKPEIIRLLWDVLPDQLDDKQKNNKLDYLQ